MNIYNNEAPIIESEFDGVYALSDLRAETVNAFKNTFEHAWQLKALLCGLEKVGY